MLRPTIYLPSRFTGLIPQVLEGRPGDRGCVACCRESAPAA
jgi:hypothetical protein